MKRHLFGAVLAAATLCTACSTLEGSRRLNLRAGLSEVKAGSAKSDRMPAASVELETSGPGEPASGVLAFDWSSGSSDAVDLPQGETDLDLKQLGVRAGLRVRPEEWDLALRPFAGAGVGWYKIEGEGAGRHEDGQDVGLWVEVGVEWGRLSLAWRAQRPDVELLEGMGDVSAQALLLGYGVGF